MEQTLTFALAQKPTKIQAGDLMVIDPRSRTIKFVRQGAHLDIVYPEGPWTDKLMVLNPEDLGVQLIICQIASLLTGLTVRSVNRDNDDRFIYCFEPAPVS